MKKYYDYHNNRLVFYGKPSNAKNWDSHWSHEDITNYSKNFRSPFVVSNTMKYLPIGAKILEGGCGKGDKAYALYKEGFDVYGIDYASKTVNIIKNIIPELNIEIGDVSSLKFSDCYFDGYWSLGVIEHFFYGYDIIASEMHRVLKSGGYLFITFPTMSPLRRLKAFFNLYPICNDILTIESEFYQFALNSKSVIDKFTSIGFELVQNKYSNGLKGLKDEISFIHSPLQWCYNGESIIAKIFRKAIDIISTPFSGHVVFLVFQKK